MRLCMEEIDVSCEGTRPIAVHWRGGVYHVSSILDHWTSRTSWWTSEDGADDHRYYLLLETSTIVMEVFRTRQGWMLSRLYD